MGSWILKGIAREKLRGQYFNTVLGSLVCYIPIYLLSLLTSILAMREVVMPIVLVLATVGEIFVVDIFNVGFIRSLIDLGDQADTDDRKYDINLVLSGFSNNYKGTLKAMFLRRLYTFGWSCLTFLPFIIALGVIAVMSIRTETAELIRLVGQLIQAPTELMAMNVAEYITENCEYMIYTLGGASILSFILIIPYIRKVYQYEMIPMIVAENPDITSADAFAKTKEIMVGYRFKYFALQLSFIGILVLVSFVIALMPFNIAMYIAMALAVPYINMTFVQFYISRTREEVKTERNDII